MVLTGGAVTECTAEGRFDCGACRLDEGDNPELPPLTADVGASAMVMARVQGTCRYSTDSVKLVKQFTTEIMPF